MISIGNFPPLPSGLKSVIFKRNRLVRHSISRNLKKFLGEILIFKIVEKQIIEVPNLGKHFLDFLVDFLVIIFAVWFWLGGVHFVHTQGEVAQHERYEAIGRIDWLSSDFPLLVVSLLDRGFETTFVDWNREKNNLTKLVFVSMKTFGNKIKFILITRQANSG